MPALEPQETRDAEKQEYADVEGRNHQQNMFEPAQRQARHSRRNDQDQNDGNALL